MIHDAQTHEHKIRDSKLGDLAATAMLGVMWKTVVSLIDSIFCRTIEDFIFKHLQLILLCVTF